MIAAKLGGCSPCSVKKRGNGTRALRNRKFLDFSVVDFEEVEEKSSHYGLHTLGFTCATRVKTKRSDGASQSKS